MAEKLQELRFKVRNKVGLLAQVTQALQAAGVNILHIVAWKQGSEGYFNLVTDQNARAKAALAKLGITAKPADILALSLRNRIGSLNRAAKKLAKAKVDVTYLIATTSGKRATVLLNAANRAKAARAL